MRHITPAVADSWTDAVPGSAARKARIFGRVHWLGRSGRGADARCLRAVLAGEALAGRAFGFALLITRCITYMVTCRTAKKNKWQSEGVQAAVFAVCRAARSEEHTSELQSLMRISYAVFCLKQKKKKTYIHKHNYHRIRY